MGESIRRSEPNLPVLVSCSHRICVLWMCIADSLVSLRHILFSVFCRSVRITPKPEVCMVVKRRFGTAASQRTPYDVLGTDARTDIRDWETANISRLSKPRYARSSGTSSCKGKVVRASNMHTCTLTSDLPIQREQ